MPNDDALYLGHMLDTAREAVSKVQGKTRRDFDQDRNLRLALTYLLQIIGEASRRVSRDFATPIFIFPGKPSLACAIR